jgi:Flp pilus assembly protein TadG
MKHLWNRGRTRRGALAPLAAVLMVPVLGMCAYSIDAGYIVLVQTDLQNTADAAALAGAEQLQDLYVQYNSPGADQSAILTTATTNVPPSGAYGDVSGGNAYVPGSPTWTAENIASQNKAGGVYLTVPDSDVSFGYTDQNGNYSSTLGGNFPNTITVVTRRDTTANNPIDLFFGPVFNKKQQSLTATSQATIYVGDVTSLKVITTQGPNGTQGVNAHILPVAYDYKMWHAFADPNSPTFGQSPDGVTHLNPNGANSLGNGKPQLKVYPYYTTPGGNNTSGSFGLVDVGLPANNAPAFRNWIDSGQTPNDINYLLSNNLLPVSLTTDNGNPGPQNWKVGPGLTNTLTANFQSVIGEANTIPLFKPAVGWDPNSTGYQAASGNGQNATYAIVGFTGVTVSQVAGNGVANMEIYLQSKGMIDPTDVFPSSGTGAPLPAGSTTNTEFGTPQTTFISAKITR